MYDNTGRPKTNKLEAQNLITQATRFCPMM